MNYRDLNRRRSQKRSRGTPPADHHKNVLWLVFKGRTRGIFENLADMRAAIDQYPHADYRGYADPDAAFAAWERYEARYDHQGRAELVVSKRGPIGSNTFTCKEQKCPYHGCMCGTSSC